VARAMVEVVGPGAGERAGEVEVAGTDVGPGVLDCGDGVGEVSTGGMTGGGAVATAALVRLVTASTTRTASMIATATRTPRRIQ
jgi:hypothetical protein